MSNIRQYNNQSRISKWLLATVLILSFFIFSGLPVPLKTKPDALQTTLVVNTQNRFEKSICYNRAFRQTLVKHQVNQFLVVPATNLTVLRNQQVKAQMINCCSIMIRRQSGFFYHGKTIPLGKSDDITITLG
jgi:hypothetical protein